MTDSEKLDLILETINNSFFSVENRLDSVENSVKELKTDVTNIKMMLENDISPRLQNIESCYTSTFDRYRDSVEEHEAMKTDIEVLKKVVTGHSEKLQQLA